MKNVIKVSTVLFFATIHLAAHGMQLKIKHPEIHDAAIQIINNVQIHNFVQNVISNLNNPAKRAESKLRRIQKKQKERALARQDKQEEKIVENPCPICREELSSYPTFLIHGQHQCHAHCWYKWLDANGDLTGDETAKTVKTACILCMEKVKLSRNTLEKRFLAYVKKNLTGLALKLLALPTLSPELAKCVVREYENATAEQRQYVSEILWQKLADFSTKCAEIFGDIIKVATPHHAGRFYRELFGMLGDKALDKCTHALATRLHSAPELIKAIAGLSMPPEYMNEDEQLSEDAKARLYLYIIWYNKPLFTLLLPRLKAAALHSIMKQPYSNQIKQRCFGYVLGQLESKKQQASLIERYMGEFPEEFIDGLVGEIGLEG